MEASRKPSEFVLTKHENKTFEGLTVQISGHAYFNCKFINCTLIFTNVPVILQGCHFQNCNWHLQYDILWGAPQTLQTIKKLVEKIDQGMPKDFKTENLQ